MASELRALKLTAVEADPAIEGLVSQLAEGPLVLESEGRPLAVLIDVDQYRDLRAVYEWHQQVLQERSAS